MTPIVLGALGILTSWFTVVFFKDFLSNRKNLEDCLWTKVIAIGFLTNFIDTLGIGSFAPTTALLKMFRQAQDRIIPGTLNVACSIPVVLEAFIFITVIEVEPVTLISMLAAATGGAYLGAGIIAGFSEKRIRIVMGTALLITAVIMFAGQMGWMPGGGEEIGLHGAMLGAAIAGNFIFGALMTAGIGLYAPCMVLVYLLGMSPRVAFPIMMGSAAFLMPMASTKFIKEGAYNRKASMGITAGGVAGVVIAAYLVKSLSIYILKWLVIGVVLYTAVIMLRDGLKSSKSEQIRNQI